MIVEKLKEIIYTQWEHEPEMVEYISRDPMLYGDFRNAIEEAEPRFYEDLLDYEAVYSLFLEVRSSSRSNKSILIDFSIGQMSIHP